MIFEIAKLTIAPENAAAFEEAVRQAVPLFKQAEGCHRMVLHRIIEQPGRYELVVKWESVAHHMDLFRNSPAFQEWRRLVGGFFTAPPEVVHLDTVGDFF